jgi:hypothetical protein
MIESNVSAMDLSTRHYPLVRWQMLAFPERGKVPRYASHH